MWLALSEDKGRTDGAAANRKCESFSSLFVQSCQFTCINTFYSCSGCVVYFCFRASPFSCWQVYWDTCAKSKAHFLARITWWWQGNVFWCSQEEIQWFRLMFLTKAIYQPKAKIVDQTGSINFQLIYIYISLSGCGLYYFPMKWLAEPMNNKGWILPVWYLSTHASMLFSHLQSACLMMIEVKLTWYEYNTLSVTQHAELNKRMHYPGITEEGDCNPQCGCRAVWHVCLQKQTTTEEGESVYL